MDPSTVIKELGGGLAATVIVAQAVAIWVLYQRNNALQDKLLDLTLQLGKEVRDIASATTTALGGYGETLREAVREMRGRK